MKQCEPKTKIGRSPGANELLKRISDNPMVILNHAVAAAMVHWEKKGLVLLDELKGDQ